MVPILQATWNPKIPPWERGVSPPLVENFWSTSDFPLGNVERIWSVHLRYALFLVYMNWLFRVGHKYFVLVLAGDSFQHWPNTFCSDLQRNKTTSLVIVNFYIIFINTIDYNMSYNLSWSSDDSLLMDSTHSFLTLLFVCFSRSISIWCITTSSSTRLIIVTVIFIMYIVYIVW